MADGSDATLTSLPPGGVPGGLAEYVTKAITTSMFEGTLRPGQRLSPMHLAEQLGVSHIPVREALSTLEATGQVTRIARRGYFVASLSTEEVEDVYRWRAVLEARANKIAVPLLTEDDLRRMRELNSQMQEAVQHVSPAAFAGLNRELHFIPIERVGSPLLNRFLTQLWDAAARYQATLLQTSTFLEQVQHQHDGLLDAYERRDVAVINRMLDEHRQTTLRAVRDGLAATAVTGSV